MRAREDFVGTISNDGYLLVDFVGEGATAVVYLVAKIDTPDKRDTVLKFIKPVPFLEMDVLHYSLRVDVVHYPNHPLLLTPMERLERLTDEMLGRISSTRFEFQVGLYHGIMRAAISGICARYSDLHRRGQLPPDFLESDEALRRRIDENLLGELKHLLEDDRINEEYVPFAEYLVGMIEQSITKWRNCGTYFPFSSNPLYNLLGLWIQNFINDEELNHIASDSRLLKEVSVDSLVGLWWFGGLLYSRVSGEVTLMRRDADNTSGQRRNGSGDGVTSQAYGENLEEELKDLHDRMAMEGVENEGRFCARAFQLGAALAGSVASNDKRLRGLADYWRGKALNLFPGNEVDVLKALESASADLQAAGCDGDLHNVLVDLAIAERESDPKRSAKHFAKAKAIRDRLGIE